jgi:hypothetical protein
VIETTFVNRCVFWGLVHFHGLKRHPKAVTTQEDIPSFALRRALDVSLSLTETRRALHGIYTSYTALLEHATFCSPNNFQRTYGNWEYMRPHIPLLVGAVIFFVLELDVLVLTSLEIVIV